jgi:hypothetical protein
MSTQIDLSTITGLTVQINALQQKMNGQSSQWARLVCHAVTDSRHFGPDHCWLVQAIMTILLPIILALIAGQSIPAIVGGLTVAQYIALGQLGLNVAPQIIKLDVAIIQKLKAQGLPVDLKLKGQPFNVQMAINGEAVIRQSVERDRYGLP